MRKKAGLIFLPKKGSSLLSLLMSLALFSFLFLTFNQWTAFQRQRAVQIYKNFQAVQIAENQKQRLFLDLPCESLVEQNQIKFSVQCNHSQVSVISSNSEISF